MPTQLEKAETFRALHTKGTTFVIPNPWDAGSAKLLSATGFRALATTSLGLANMLGRGSGLSQVSLQEAIGNCRAISGATDLPVSADLENCYADDPGQAAETIRLAAEAGVVGGSIEDAKDSPSGPVIYEYSHAVERVHAAVEVARSLPMPFTLTARAENLFRGKGDLDDTILRLQAYEAAGADVLYPTGLKDLDTIRTVVGAVTKPVNIAIGGLGPSITVADLESAGVRRISLGGALSQLALTAVVRAAREIATAGTFTFTRDSLSSRELKPYFGKS